MANIKDFIKKIGNETVSLEEQQKALAAVEQTIVEAKAKREESIGKNVDLVISALKKIESDLEAKLVELNNTPAKQGVAGPQGEKGRDGRDGKDGYKGQDGKDGVDGQDGKDGKDGISVTDAKVDFDGSLVITLSDGREIDAGTVISSDVAKNIHSVQTAGTGSTSQAVLDAIAAIQATIATYGTMATQNANAVAITGGTINGTTIGATTATTGAFTTLTSTGGAVNGTVIGGTTPAAGTFTTITGQTEVLKGTGTNLVVRSQEFDNASWGKTSVTVTANSTTAPDGSSTADTITANAADSICYQSLTTSSVGLTYTFSVYLKADVATNLSISVYDVPTYNATLTACAVTTSWQRFTVTRTLASGVTSILATIGGNSTFSTGETVYAWGAQVEVGSTANTYIPTTTTAIYGTPTLSFSGVAGLGLQSDGSLYVSPAGTGALQAQATTSTTAGGNARGANAVDWQTLRGAAARVASGGQSAILGGNDNTASTTNAGVLAGSYNTALGFASGVGTGQVNTASGYYGFVSSGNSNIGSGYYGFVGNGYANSTTSNSSVTTQSATMNGTTAVTLSGSNASIKVGQLISGTYINTPYTYVAAISGTSLTLSQVASGSGTATLSFYTPHGVVVGGGNNQATGSYSFIGGGGDAGTAANRNVASGDWSFVGGGTKNVASSNFSAVLSGGFNTASTSYGSVVCGGGFYGNITSQFAGNTASGISSFVGSGFGNTASANFSSVSGGGSNTANAGFSTVVGGYYGTTRSIVGNMVFSPSNNPIGTSANGTQQSALLVLARQTTDATATVLTSDANAASGTNQVILPNNSAYYFKIEVIAGVTGAGNTKAWELKGAIKRGAGVGTTAIVGSVTTTVIAADAGASAWTLTATADTTNGGITVTATGQASTTIRWVARCTTTEMTY